MKTTILVVLAAVLSFSLIGCTDEDNARRVLSQNGYTQIQMTGYAPFMCSDQDTFSTGFTAKSPGGQQVAGSVCSSFTKGNTIRFK